LKEKEGEDKDLFFAVGSSRKKCISLSGQNQGIVRKGRGGLMKERKESWTWRNRPCPRPAIETASRKRNEKGERGKG